jgi:hypothetical protein
MIKDSWKHRFSFKNLKWFNHAKGTIMPFLAIISGFIKFDSPKTGHRRGTLSRWGALIAMTSLAGIGCLSIYTPGPTTVIERSSSYRPDWADNDPDVDTAATEVFLVTRKKNVLRLELGTKQAEIQAISSGESQILKLASEWVTQKLKTKNPNDYAAKTPQIQQAFQSLAKKEALKDPVVKQVYWENIQVDTPEGPKSHFDIYVLTSLKREIFFIYLAQGLDILLKSGDPVLAPLARSLLEDDSSEETPNPTPK